MSNRPSRADLLFPAEPGQRGIARELYAHARDLPIISPHGHVDPGILADDAPFPDPAQLIIVPDHYLTRMLLSQGVPPHRLGVATRNGDPAETDGRTIWRTFAEHWHLFRGTPSRLWLEQTFAEVFGVDLALRAATPPTRSTTSSPSGWPSRSSARGRCSSGSTSRCWPRPSPHWTIWPGTPSWPPTAGAARAAG